MPARPFVAAAFIVIALIVLPGSRPALLAADTKQKASDLGGSIEVDMVGTIRTDVVAVGGETTGTTITALGLTWELDFQGNKENAATAAKLNGREGSVKGTLTVKEGVEVKRRYIVIVKQIRELTN